jgi:metal-sulfur cluster biosynthetic enzyme
MLQLEARGPLGEAECRAAIMMALDAVVDPELDESVTSMGFIERVELADNAVEISFRLPTFWCSANFAFLMAVDMKTAIEALSWVDQATVRLIDHFAAGKINRGIASSQSFVEVFAGDATGNLDTLRRTFQEKAFLGRQERLLRLLAELWGREQALTLTLVELRALGRHENGELRAAALRYLAARLHDGGPAGEGDAAFTTLLGETVTPAGYADHLRTLRRVRGAAEANAEMCRIYLQARTTHPVPEHGPNDTRDFDTAG